MNNDGDKIPCEAVTMEDLRVTKRSQGYVVSSVAQFYHFKLQPPIHDLPFDIVEWPRDS